MAMIQCDRCQGILDPKGIKMKMREEEGLTVQYFRCTKCGQTYTAVVMDDLARKEIQTIKKETRRIRNMIQANAVGKKCIRKETIRKAEQKLESRKKNTLAYMNRLKAEYEVRRREQGTAEAVGAGDPGGIQPGASGPENPEHHQPNAAAVSGTD